MIKAKWYLIILGLLIITLSCAGLATDAHLGGVALSCLVGVAMVAMPIAKRVVTVIKDVVVR